MLVVTQLNNKKLSIKSDYFYRGRIKEIPSAVFDHETKQWIIEQSALPILENNFKGELVYKTPRWVILNQPMPDMSHMYKIPGPPIQIPVLKLKPYDFQDYGIRFMVDRIINKRFVLNADDVGLGKTSMTIGTLKWFVDNSAVRKILIICKKSIKTQWIEEIDKFTDISQSFWVGKTGETPAKRKKAYDAFAKASAGILVVNYHVFLNDTDILKALRIDFVVIDEVHVVKNRLGKINNNMTQVVQGKPTVFLTGTPIMSKPEDIFGIVQITAPGYFGDWKKFSKRFIQYEHGGPFGTRVVGGKDLDTLRKGVQDIVIRRTEYEVTIQLPKTIISQVDCAMDKTQENILLEIQKSQDDITTAFEKLKVNGVVPDYNQDKANQLEGKSKGLIAARQAASTDPRLFLMSSSKMMKEVFGSMIPKTYKKSQKSETILELLEDIISSGDKVILFTKFRTCALMLAEDIQKELSEKVLLYTGAENDDVRDKTVDAFKNTASYNILIGTEALSEGLNLQCARYVVNIDQPDTLAIKTQRIGRSRRAGSVYDSITVYDVVTSDSHKAKSKDMERLNNILNNQDLTDALINIDESQRSALIQAMQNQN